MTITKSKTTVVATVPKDVNTLYKSVSVITNQALSLTIKGAGDMTQASAMRESLKKKLKEITAKKDEVLQPLLEATKAERSRWKPAEDKINQAIEQIDGAMSKYQTAQRKIELAKEEAIANRIGEGKGKLSAEKAVAKLDDMKRVDNKVSSDAGATAFVTVPKFKLVDLSKVPVQYHLLDEVAIRKLMIAGVKVEGIEYYTVEQPRSSR